MKSIVFISLGMLLVINSNGQTIYTDPAVSAATAVHAGIINSNLEETKKKLTLIEKGQLAVTGQLGIVNSIQDKIYKGLSEVSSILTNLSNVKEISRISFGIIDDLDKGMAIALKNPVFLLFAEEQAKVFKDRTTKLALEVSSFVFKGGANNLMDSGERYKILNNILTEMLLIRSLTYGIYRSMYYAQMRGLVNSLNPFKGYVEMDMQVIDDIIRKRKYLKE